MKLYFTRHGKTEWNQSRQLQGRTGDSPLLPASYEEIHLLGQYIKNVNFAHVYSSAALRAQVTTEGICEELCHKPQITFVEELREMGFGSLEGEYIKIADAAYPAEMNAMMHEPDKYNPESFGGETYESLIERSTSFVKRIAIGYGPEDKLLFVGHGMALTACVQSLLGTPLTDLRKDGGLKNNSLTILNYTDGAFTLDKWNDVSFLAE
ncbi:histidine phosphatase family protein [Vagococcus vulneris]|uniref:Histidine phosphatase family protein n=1 Tax=Vagococcus vulneris TaxID=1977869 RepID=A0A429ZV85_9ENTE|nr:histidine phosphatase family protein [Vagococcus vulneris]RST97670.1 hypothetical protein CBF37_09355 [Vagococcus vulneris]